MDPPAYAIKVGNFTDMQGFLVRYNTIAAGILIDPGSGSDVRMVGNVGAIASCPSDITYAYNVWKDQVCSLTDTEAADALDDFVDPGGHDWRPEEGSAVIDAGSPTEFPTTDRAEIARPQGTAADAGAHEFVDE
jgi:hypothetical protein